MRRHCGRTALTLAFALAAAFVFVPAPAHAHGGLSMEQDMCKLRIGPYAMHFTGYQPEATGTKEFCEDIPEVGHTIVAFDAIDPPLRSVPLEVRVIRDTGDEHDLEAITVLHLQPKVYPTGSVTFEHNFNEAGKFVGLVMTSDDKGQYVSRFPFSVARGWTRLQPYLIGGLVILAGVGFYWYSVTYSQLTSKARRKAQ
jgi:hypothetical protein